MYLFKPLASQIWKLQSYPVDTKKKFDRVNMISVEAQHVDPVLKPREKDNADLSFAASKSLLESNDLVYFC